MSDKTYIELYKNNKSTIQISVYDRNTGQPYYPSAAFYQVKGSIKDNILIPKSSANVNKNNIYTTITQSITSSASEYDIIWEIHKTDGNIRNHCTKLLVLDEC